MVAYTLVCIAVIGIAGVVESTPDHSIFRAGLTAVKGLIGGVSGVYPTSLPVTSSKNIQEDYGYEVRNTNIQDGKNPLDDYESSSSRQLFKDPEAVTPFAIVNSTEDVSTVKPQREPQDPNSPSNNPSDLTDSVNPAQRPKQPPRLEEVTSEIRSKRPEHPGHSTNQEPSPRQPEYPTKQPCQPEYTTQKPREPEYIPQQQRQFEYPSLQPRQPEYPPHQPSQPEYPPRQPEYPSTYLRQPEYNSLQPRHPTYPPQQPPQPEYILPQPRQPEYPPQQPQYPPTHLRQPEYLPQLDYYQQYHWQPLYPPPQPQPAVYPIQGRPVYPLYPQQPQQPFYPNIYSPQQPQPPISLPNKTSPASESDSNNRKMETPYFSTDYKANHSIIIINLNDFSAQHGSISLNQVLSVLQGKPGFVYTLQSGGQGKFVPLTHLNLLPQNSIPSYIVLLLQGQPNLVLNPGLQLINGLLPTGKLDFLTSNSGGLNTFPIYLADSYKSILSILNNFGLNYSNQNGNSIPEASSSPPPPGSINVGELFSGSTTSNQIGSSGSSLDNSLNKIDVNSLMHIFDQQTNDIGDDNTRRVDETNPSYHELIKQLLQLQKTKSGGKENIYQENTNVTHLLQVIIELICKKNGLQQDVIRSQHERNPAKLMQTLVELMRKESSSSTAISHNHEPSKLVQLLVELISNQESKTLSQGITSDSNLMNIVLQSLKHPELMQVQESGNVIDNQLNLSQLINRLSNFSKDFGASSLNLGGGSGSSSEMNKLLEILNQQHTIQDRRSVVTDGSGVNSNILNILLESGSGKNVKSALWSYLLGHQSCVNYEDHKVLCAK